MDNVGSIAYDARIETKNFGKDADAIERRAGQVASSVENSGRGFRNFANEASSSFDSVADGIGRVLKSALLLGTTGAFGIGAATKASWDQVAAVEQATVGLRAYERDGNKVNAVLKDLITYARSDLGVLFNRKDLFESAQMLKLNGVATEDLNKDVQILSRSVGLGLGNWQDLNAVVGRVIATGRLSGIEFDQLTQYGFKLDKSLRNTDISATALFETLDKGIPVDAMAGQANTIRGLGIRMETSFRGIGDAILGVDADTSKFIKGGLGDRLIGILGTLTNLLKNPELKEGFRKMGEGIASFAEKAIPVLIDGFTWIVQNSDTVVNGIAAVAAAFVAAKLAAIGFSIAASANPIGLIAGAIVLLVGVLTFLQIKFDIFGKAMAFLSPVVEHFKSVLNGLYNIFKTYILPVLIQVGQFILGELKEAWKNMKTAISTISTMLEPFISKGDQLKLMLTLLLTPVIVIVGAIVAFIAVVVAVIAVIAVLINFVSKFITVVNSGIGEAIKWFSGLHKIISQAMQGAGSWLYDIGKSIIQGLINGIQDMVGAVQKTAGNIGKSVQDKFKSVMGIKSPSTVFAMYGKNIAQGLSIGIDKNAKLPNQSISSMVGGINAPGLSAPMPMSSLDSLDSVKSSSSASVTINLSGIMTRSKSDERDIAKTLIQRVNEELSAKNQPLIGGGAI